MVATVRIRRHASKTPGVTGRCLPPPGFASPALDDDTAPRRQHNLSLPHPRSSTCSRKRGSDKRPAAAPPALQQRQHPNNENSSSNSRSRSRCRRSWSSRRPKSSGNVRNRGAVQLLDERTNGCCFSALAAPPAPVKTDSRPSPPPPNTHSRNASRTKPNNNDNRLGALPGV